MRRGERLRPWSVSDVRWLVESAGMMPLRDICRHLGRSDQSVRSRAALLRRSGVDVPPLRYHRSTLVWCDHCATWRTRVDDMGMCPVCAMRSRLAAARGVEDGIVAALPDADRARRRVHTHGSRIDPRPRAPDTSGMSAVRAARAEDDHCRRVEAWEIANIRRELKATWRRIERMREKIQNECNERKNRR